MPKPRKTDFPETEYWPFEHLRAWNPKDFMIFVEELWKMKDMPCNSTNQVNFMKNLEKSGFYERKRTGKTDEEYIKRWGSYVSLIYFWGLGATKKGKFELSEMSEYLIKTKNIRGFLKIQMRKFQYPHGSLRNFEEWKKEGKQIIPFLFLLEIMVKLAESSLKESYLSRGELLTYVQKAKTNKEVNSIVKKILEDRQNNTKYNLEKFPSKVVNEVNRLFPCFSGTGLLEFNKQNDSKTICFKNEEQLDGAKEYLEEGYEFYKFKDSDDWKEYYGKLPSKIPRKIIEKIEDVKNIDEFHKVEKGIREKVKKYNKHLLIELDRKLIGKHRKRTKSKSKEQRIRSPSLYELIKIERSYKCQYCGTPSFNDKYGNNFVVTHHIIEYNDEEDGPDRKDNIVILCPNCHSMFHRSKEDDIKRYYHDMRENGSITFNQFLRLIEDNEIDRKQIDILLKKGIISEDESRKLKKFIKSKKGVTLLSYQ